MDGKVSAIITTYRRSPKVVANAVNSILNQTFPVTEILIVDDNVNDSEYSKNIMSYFKDYSELVRYIKQEKGNGNCGACEARNLGIEEAEGDYICFLDDDDYWLPEKVEKQLSAFEENVGLVYCCGIVEEAVDDDVKKYDYVTSRTFKQEVTYIDLLRRDYVGSTSNPMIKAECFKTCGMFNKDMPARQDYEMWIRISRMYRVKGIKDKLFVHTLHKGEQISTSSPKVINGYKKLLEINKDEYEKDPEAMYLMCRRLVMHLKKQKDLEYLKYSLLSMIEKMKMLTKKDN